MAICQVLAHIRTESEWLRRPTTAFTTSAAYTMWRGNVQQRRPRRSDFSRGQIQKAHFFEIKVLVIVMMVLVIVVTVVVAVAKKGVDIKAVLVKSRYMAIKREEKEVKNKQDYQEDKRGIKSESEE